MGRSNRFRVVCGDVLSFCRHFRGEKFHALLSDPPYHLTSIVKRFGKDGSKPSKSGVYARASRGFMNATWDGGDIAFRPETWTALADHLYPGAFIMAFAGSRGWHRQAVAMEDAGLIMHPSIFLWAYGSGFPKATRIDTQIDKAAGMKRVVVGYKKGTGKKSDLTLDGGMLNPEYDDTVPATPLAREWQGHRYGLQALKPAAEPILVFQKPYEGKPVESITGTGAGALNVDGGRIGIVNEDKQNARKEKTKKGKGVKNLICSGGWVGTGDGWSGKTGRWPANLILSHHPDCIRVGTKTIPGYDYDSESMPDETIDDWQCIEGCPVKALGEQADTHSAGFAKPNTAITAARFFFNADWSLDVQGRIESAKVVQYVAKAAREERDAGLSEFEMTYRGDGRDPNLSSANVPQQRASQRHNHHPTQKPLTLTRYLASLLLPLAAYAPRRLLVPFAGAGSEMIGAMLAGWEEIIGVEGEHEYCALAQARLDYWAGVGVQESLL